MCLLFMVCCWYLLAMSPERDVAFNQKQYNIIFDFLIFNFLFSTMNNKLTEGVDFYYNEEGFIVLTEKYHLDKGFCCGNGCKHCPYDYEAVPEPKRSLLINNQTCNQK